MTEFIVHIQRHCGWHTTTAEGETFGEAAIAAVVATCKQFGLDLDNIPHTVDFIEEDIPQSVGGIFHSRRVRFFEASERRVFDPWLGGADGWRMTRPGEVWLSDRVEEGKPGDCTMCGGTRVDFHNPFKGCWKCTDGSNRKLEAVKA